MVFVFFFKQKTAYEMRISDWSSDVCSSDLSAAVPMTVAQAATTAPKGYPRDMCHAISITGRCADGRIGDGNWDYMAYFPTNSASYPTEPTSADRIAWFGTDTPTRYDVYKYEMANSATRRSDEQTSELQSPMRISYAA